MIRRAFTKFPICLVTYITLGGFIWLIVKAVISAP